MITKLHTSMTTEEILWNQRFEQEVEVDDSYSYKEEYEKENYYEEKDLMEQFREYFKPDKSI